MFQIISVCDQWGAGEETPPRPAHPDYTLEWLVLGNVQSSRLTLSPHCQNTLPPASLETRPDRFRSSRRFLLVRAWFGFCHLFKKKRVSDYVRRARSVGLFEKSNTRGFKSEKNLFCGSRFSSRTATSFIIIFISFHLPVKCPILHKSECLKKYFLLYK